MKPLSAEPQRVFLKNAGSSFSTILIECPNCMSIQMA